MNKLQLAQWTSWGSLLLQDDAKSFFNGKLRDLIPLLAILNMPWAQFTNINTTGYFQPRSQKQAMLKLERLSLGSKTVPELVREMHRLHALVTPKRSEEDLIHILTEAFNPTLQRDCELDSESKQWSDLTDLIECATFKDFVSSPVFDASMLDALGASALLRTPGLISDTDLKAAPRSPSTLITQFASSVSGVSSRVFSDTSAGGNFSHNFAQHSGIAIQPSSGYTTTTSANGSAVKIFGMAIVHLSVQSLHRKISCLVAEPGTSWGC